MDLLNIKLVGFNDGIVLTGFRRISSTLKSKYPNTTSYLYDVGGNVLIAKNIFFDPKSKQSDDDIPINKQLIDEIAGADVIGFSCMSKYASHVKKAISMIRSQNNKSFIVWGGIHATVFPEDAIKHADAVCIGEGEKSFLSLLEKLGNKQSIEDSKGFWIRKENTIKKNKSFPLMSNRELSTMIFQGYSFDIKFVTDEKISKMTKEIYLSKTGTMYFTMWVMGCPFKCTYCSNNKFLKNNNKHGNLRFSDPNFLMEEISTVLEKHDYIRSVQLDDDSFIMLKTEQIEQFARLYKEKIGLPLSILGLHPAGVNKEKMEILVNAGLIQVRMGIQSGSQKTLHFYNRHTPEKMILNAVEIISSFIPKINPPIYDIIVDNPVETKKDKDDTLQLLRKFKRPFIPAIYGLRIIEGTGLHEFAQDNPQYDFKGIEDTYKAINDKEMYAMIYLISFFKTNEFTYNFFQKISANKFLNKYILFFVKLVYVVKRAYYEIIKLKSDLPLGIIHPYLPILSWKFRNTLSGNKRQRNN